MRSVFGLLLLLAGAGEAAAASAVEALRFDNPSWSADGRWLALADARRDSVYLYDLEAKTALRIAASPSSGYALNWAPDGTRLGFKLLLPNGSPTPLQAPAYFDVGRRELVALHPPVARAGVPSFSADGRIAFTIDQDLWIADDAGRLLKTFALGSYANLARSPRTAPRWPTTAPTIRSGFWRCKLVLSAR